MGLNCLCSYMTQHPAAFPQQAAQQNGSAKITYTSYYAYAAWQVAPHSNLLHICCQIAPYQQLHSVINVSLLPLPQSTTCRGCQQNLIIISFCCQIFRIHNYKSFRLGPVSDLINGKFTVANCHDISA